jgi:tRNA (mo5U34)-methyltransferase
MSSERTQQLIRSKEWYHTIEVAPGVFTPGRYNPATLLDAMGFPRDFSGKTVLDIGCYDGFFSFEAERRGAKRVLATDRHPIDHCGFAAAHELLGSKVEYAVASVFDLDPAVHGTFDIVLFLGVFYHLRHPLLSLEKIRRVCTEYMFLETQVLDSQFVQDGKTISLNQLHPGLANAMILQFYPGVELNNDPSNWFSPTTKALEAMVATSGFAVRDTRRFGGRASVIADCRPFEIPQWYDL